jgi:hypothetical protein
VFELFPIIPRGKSWLDQTVKLDDLNKDIGEDTNKTKESKTRWIPDMGQVTLIVFIAVIIYLAIVMIWIRYLK